MANNKPIHIIVTIVILVAVFSALFIFQNQVFSQEQANNVSPFGINAFYVPESVATTLALQSSQEVIQALETQTVPEYLNLGVSWGRIHPAAFGSFSWDNIDSDKDGRNLNFSSQDSYVQLAQKYNINLLPSLSPESNWLQDSNYVPANIEAYRSYVRQTVERYDGDGVNDVPGLLFPIKYWQLDNEADLRYTVRGDGFESPSEYYQVLKATYEAVKAADPSALLMINVAGAGQGMERLSIDYIRTLMALGAKDCFDVFSYHVYPTTYDPAIFQNYLQEIKAMIGDKPIWITETAISDQPDSKAQARWLVKDYVFHLAGGVEKIFWLALPDGAPDTSDLLARNGGLITFGETKKLSYYTYKKTAEILSGSDWTNIQTIQDSGDVQIYRFIKNGDPVFVVWWDYFNDPTYIPGMAKQAVITDVQGSAAVLTEAVPIFASGEEVTDYNTAFRANILMVKNGTVSLNLRETPVFVEIQ
jgi:hypothetical protein